MFRSSHDSIVKENMNKIMQITAFKAILAWKINIRGCEQGLFWQVKHAWGLDRTLVLDLPSDQHDLKLRAQLLPELYNTRSNTNF